MRGGKEAAEGRNFYYFISQQVYYIKISENMLHLNTSSGVITQQRSRHTFLMTTVDSIEIFVKTKYLEVLQRPADLDELLHYTEAIKAGDLKREELVDILKNLDEFKHGIKRIDSDAEVVIVSTYGIQCGIATYTSYLLESLKKICTVDVLPVNDGVSGRIDFDGVLNYQHEYGIFGDRIPVSKHSVVTWHTVLRDHPVQVNVDTHIVHSEETVNEFPGGNVHVIPHGSMVFPEGINKMSSRSKLNLPQGIPIILIFGFRTPNKMYDELLQILAEVRKKEKILAIFTASPHGAEDARWREHFERYENSEYVLVLNRWISEDEVNLYALASDIFLFNYMPEEHYSASGALHRIIGAGKPVVCNRDAIQFNELEEDKVALKYNTKEAAAEKILELIRNTALARELQQGAKSFAERTSWDKVAKMYLDVCRGVAQR